MLKFSNTLREKCPYLELFGVILRISPYLVQIWENASRITSNTDTFYAATVS